MDILRRILFCTLLLGMAAGGLGPAHAADEPWEVVKQRLESRERLLFGVKPASPEAEELARRAPPAAAGVPASALLPDEAPLTPDELSEERKAQTLRRFENEQKFDVERDLRDLLNELRQ
jgi:hypothetical protein